ncbi:hypothetical protein RintRC_4140 [Richelia intracellularis]|nr:hypothetical protein RintRC_4140 [Richelia intracellularis]
MQQPSFKGTAQAKVFYPCSYEVEWWKSIDEINSPSPFSEAGISNP